MKIIILALLCLTFTTFAAEDKAYQRLLSAIPEIEQPPEQIKSTNPAMKCLVDTPAFDRYRFGACISVGWAHTTSAVFKIDFLPSNFTIIWSNSSCNQQSSTCSVSISQYSSITMSATVLDNTNGTFTSTSATAYYEGFD
ncbi:MAG: hypothetical protein JKX98_08360 [Alcanivoracaceae bacterium]|nr:hypothetical protein [Alcanivoracaceae bacterium]